MNGMQPNCIDDFLFSNPSEKQRLDYILTLRMPFPFGGKNGIMLHGTWGTGKTTLAKLLPCLIEAAHKKTWNVSNGAGQMPAVDDSDVTTDVFRCGGGLSITDIVGKINARDLAYPFWHASKHHYYVFDEVDKLTTGAQQSLKSIMGLKRCMFFFTTNYPNRVDLALHNRCHLIEMNQASDLSAYVPIGQSILAQMGLLPSAISAATIQAMAGAAKGSMRDFIDDVVLAGIGAGGAFPAAA